MAITLEELEIKFSAEMGGLNSQLNSIKNQIGGIAAPTAQAHNALGGLSKLGKVFAGAAIGAKLLDIGKDSIAMANDAVESENLFEVSMGEMAGSTRKWSDDLSKSLGLNAIEVRKAAGTFNVMFNSMGIGAPKAQEMSQSLTALAQDMASFYNLSPDEAFTKLSAGITGEAEPLKRLGILIDENTIKTFAYENGIADMGSELTQNQKTLARYGAIMKQTSKAQGDLARTAESPANQLRRMTAQVDAAKIALGTALQPALLAVLPVLTSLATGVGDVIKSFNSGGTTISDAFGDVGISIEQAKEIVAANLEDGKSSVFTSLADLKTKTDAAFDAYAAATNLTKDVLVAISMTTTTTGVDEFNRLYTAMKAVIGQTTETVDKYIETYLTPLLKEGEISQGQYDARVKALKDKLDRMANLTNLDTKVQALVTAAMEDGKVDSKEVNRIKLAIDDDVKKATQSIKGIEATMIAQVKADLKNKLITPQEAQAQITIIETTTDAQIAALGGAAVEAKASVTVGDWTVQKITPTQIGEITRAVEAELKAGGILSTETTATVKANFKAVLGEEYDTSVVGDAVDVIYAEANTKAATAASNLQALFADGVDIGGPEWVAAVTKAQQTYQEAIDFITNGGLTGEGKINKALAGLDQLSGESVANVVTAYKEYLTSQTDSMNSATEYAVNDMYNKKAEYTKAFAVLGITFEQGVANFRAKAAENLAALQSGVIIDEAKNLVPAISKALASGDLNSGELSKLRGQLVSALKDIDFSSLSEEGKQAAIELYTLFEQTLNDGTPMGAAVDSAMEDMIAEIAVYEAKASAGFSAIGVEGMKSLSLALKTNLIPKSVYDQIILANSTGTLAELITMFREAGDEATANLIEGLLEDKLTVGESGKAITDSLRQAMEDGQITKAQYDAIIGTEYSKESLAALAALMYKYGDKSAGDLVLGLLEKLTSVEEAARLLAEAAQAEPGSGYGAGSAYVQGLIEGLKSKEEELRQTANRIAALVDKNARRTMEEKSPSKVAFRTGAYYGEGLALGMLDTTGMVSSAANKLSGSANLALGGLSASSFNVPSIDSSYGTIKSMVSEMMGAMSINLYVDQTQLGKAVFDAVRHLNAAYGFRS